MTKDILEVTKRIRDEFDDLRRVIEKVKYSCKQGLRTGDDAYWDSVALNLHGFYDGLERLFELIAEHIDESKPQGSHWHQLLLDQMATEQAEIRPAVISNELKIILDDYRGFRHVVRHVYFFRFDLTKLKERAENLPDVFDQASRELLAFADFLEYQAQLDDELEVEQS